MKVGVAVSLSGATLLMAQPGYGQPNYGPRNYNQPSYNQQYDQPGYGQSGQDFYDELGPYGQWVQTPEYGNVWIPDVEPGFQPYATNGHWVVTEYGNTWVSDYAWGWAPFHYGRWYQDRYRGWAWVPGNDWGPAWVSWRSGGGYYGWAPLGPGININVNVNIPYNYWTFVPQVYITSPRLYSYCVPRPRVINVYQNTTIINNVYRSNNRAYAYGPRREEIESVTRRSVPVYRIENADRPGRDVIRGNAVGIYRPDMNRGGRDNTNPYATDRRNYPRSGGYSSNRGSSGNGNGGGYSRNNQPQTNRPYSQQEESLPRNSRYGRQSQPDQPVSQPGQAYPQPGRPEPAPQPQWGRGRRQEPISAPQRENSQPPVGGQPQEQRAADYQPRGREQSQSPQGSYPERRGGSRGPR